MSNIDVSTIDYLCKLSKLSINKSEKISLSKDLDKIIDYIDVLKEVDTSNVKPLIYLTKKKKEYLREDKAENNYSRENILKNTPDKNSTYIKVPKVMP